MSVPLYMDEHVHSAITDGLRRRGVDVVTAQEDGSAGLADPILLSRALELGRVLVTADHDFEIESARRQRLGIAFPGIVYVNFQTITVGGCIDDLALVGLAGEPADFASRLLYLPL